MYRCSICPVVSEPGQPRLLHAVLRRDGSIERELPVCGDCWRRLASGTPLAALRAAHVKPKPEAVAAAAAADPQTEARPTAAGDEL